MGKVLRRPSGLAFDVTSRPFVKPQGSASIPSRLVSARFEMTQTEHRFALIPRLRQPPLGMTGKERKERADRDLSPVSPDLTRVSPRRRDANGRKPSPGGPYRS